MTKITDFTKQPVLSADELVSFLKQFGLDLAMWPKCDYPPEVLEKERAFLDGVVDWLEQEFQADPDQLKSVDIKSCRSAAVKKMVENRSIIRTAWGMLVAEKDFEYVDEVEALIGTYTVDIHATYGWNNENLASISKQTVDEIKALMPSHKSSKHADHLIKIDCSGRCSVAQLTCTFNADVGKTDEDECKDALTTYLIELIRDEKLNGILQKIFS
jgi:hypothetical protein